jgi:hypothetical protein
MLNRRQDVPPAPASTTRTVILVDAGFRLMDAVESLTVLERAGEERSAP